MAQAHHPKGIHARVLLTSVFGPYAQDDEFGSRSINPMELYQNQVTREQGPFSLRMFHGSWGIKLIQHNISGPSTLLDFPSRARFIHELTHQRYDVIGISGIIVNVWKVREMCRLAREHSPHSQIVVGGHVTAIPGIEHLVDADHMVKGEGVAWMRAYLGEDPAQPIVHPPIASSFGFRIMGLPMSHGVGRAATIIPSVGCPIGCDFCTTSAFFGGKGKSVCFFDNGADLFEVMCQAEEKLGLTTFFMMDENFLLDRKRAMELLELMKANGKAWSLYVFASANAVAKYELRELVELGISWVWLGLESPNSSYSKLNGADTRALTSKLRAHGIRVLGSTIVGLEHHTPGNIAGEIEQAVAHDTDFHQFMLFTPVPGTPLYQRMKSEGRLLSEVDLADIHGQYQFNFQHKAITPAESKSWLDWAFRLDFERNGPSLFRLIRTTVAGWRRYRDDLDPRIRERFTQERKEMAANYAAALWAMERYFHRSNARVSARVREVWLELDRELGGLRRACNRLIGPVVLWAARREARRFPHGRVIEPPQLEHRGSGVSTLVVRRRRLIASRVTPGPPPRGL
jgi:hypothetical protein